MFHNIETGKLVFFLIGIGTLMCLLFSLIMFIFHGAFVGVFIGLILVTIGLIKFLYEM